MNYLDNAVQHLLGSVEHHGGFILDVGPLHRLGQHRGGVSEGLSDVVHCSGITQLSSHEYRISTLSAKSLPQHPPEISLTQHGCDCVVIM